VVLAVKADKLSVGYESDRGVLWAVDSVDLGIAKGEVFCVVGESGCGKTTLGNTIAGLLPPYARTRGRLEVEGVTVVDGDRRDYSRIRGRVVSRIPQDPASSLNPFQTVGEQLVRVLTEVRSLREGEAKSKALELLSSVKLPTSVYDMYPHQLSGGMKQRAAIALAISTNPSIIVADEPTSALDAYLRCTIAELIKSLSLKMSITVIFITHDIKLAGSICSRIAVMYAGKIVEEGPTERILKEPLHPYTEALLNAVPRRLAKTRLQDIPGSPPSPFKYPPGCRFAPRCPYAMDICMQDPPRIVLGDGGYAYCWRRANTKS